MAKYYDSGTNTSSAFYTTTSVSGAWETENPVLQFTKDDGSEVKKPKKADAPAIKIDSEVIGKLLDDPAIQDDLRHDALFILHGSENEKLILHQRSKTLPYFGINSGSMRYNDIFSMNSVPEVVGYWVNYLLLASPERKLDINMFRYLFYISLCRKGGFSKATTWMFLEVTPVELQKIHGFFPDVGISIESISEMAKFNNDRLLIKLLGKWNLKKR